MASINDIVTKAMEHLNGGSEFEDAIAQAQTYYNQEFAEDELGVIRHEVRAAQARQAHEDESEEEIGQAPIDADTEISDYLGEPYDESRQSKIEDYSDDEK